MITKRQKQILNYITKYELSKGFAPSLSEISKNFKLSSVSTVHQHIEALENKGLLQKDKNQPRGIEILKNEFSLSTAPRKVNKKRTESIEFNKVQLKDVVIGLRELPDETCDVIIADPPYNIGKDFGNASDKQELSEYIQWCKEWMDECVRVLKPNGTIFIYGFSEILAYLSVELKINKRWLIWHYTNKNVASLNFWQRSHESIICAWKEKPLFNRDDIREPYTEGFLKGAAGKVRKGTHGRFSSSGKETTYKAHIGGALPRDVIKIPALAGGAGMVERWFLCKTCERVYEPQLLKRHAEHYTIKHPTQKPQELTQKLIQSSQTNGVSTILIPFSGSGSECVMAKKMGHNFIGFEINPDYLELSNKWIDQTTPIPRLF